MKGIIAEHKEAPLQVTDDLELPELSANQILIKSIYTAINPVYGLLFCVMFHLWLLSHSQLTSLSS
jgi:hypothetical protein